jgi:hypothetical protein
MNISRGSDSSLYSLRPLLFFVGRKVLLTITNLFIIDFGHQVHAQPLSGRYSHVVDNLRPSQHTMKVSKC